MRTSRRHSLSAAALRCLLLVGLLHAGSSSIASEWAGVDESGLPDRLSARLMTIARSGLAPEEMLRGAALLLLDSGWLADSLSTAGGELLLLRPRERAQRYVQWEGEPPAPPWSPDDVFTDPRDLERGVRDWLAALDRQGHPFAQVWLRPAGADDAAVLDLEPSLLPGPSGTLGNIRLTGQVRLREEFLRSYLGLEQERPFSLSEARRGGNRLRASGWFLDVSEPVLGWDPVARRVGVLYRLVEKPRPNRVTALVGGGSGETSGALDVDMFSPFGAGRRWRLRADWQGRGRSRMDIAFGEPRLLGRSLALELSFHRVSQDSTYLQQSAQVDLSLPLPDGWVGITGFGYERSLFGLAQEEMSRRRHRFGLTWRSLARGRAGERHVRLVTDLLIKRSGLAGERPDSKQWEGRADWQWTQPLSDFRRVRLRGQALLLWEGEGTGFNQAELFPLGGARSLRGYDEEQFLGDRVASGSLEWGVGDPLELSLFLDYGWGRWLRVDGDEVRFDGWGIGVGLLAPGRLGSLSLALALGEEKSLSGLRVHLAVNTGF